MNEDNKIPCEREVRLNIVRVECGKPLTLSLAVLNRSCDFRKKWNKFYRRETIKVCVVCQDKFKVFGRSGRRQICSEECLVIKRKAYKQKPEIKAKRKIYRNTPEVKARYKAYRKVYHQRPEVKAKQKEYYQKNKLKFKAKKKKYYQKNKLKFKAKQKEYYQKKKLKLQK